MIEYRQAVSGKDENILAELGLLLYPGENTFESLYAEAQEHLDSDKWATFLAVDTITNKAIGMGEFALRADYVEGMEGDGDIPIGYAEGIFTMPEYRKQYIAKKLVEHGENWARKNGCIEFASDCYIDNTDSFSFHLKIGFAEAGRVIHFIKKL